MDKSMNYKLASARYFKYLKLRENSLDCSANSPICGVCRKSHHLEFNCKHNDLIIRRKNGFVSQSFNVAVVDNLSDDITLRVDDLLDRMLMTDSYDVISVDSVDESDSGDVISRDTSCSFAPTELMSASYSMSRKFGDSSDSFCLDISDVDTDLLLHRASKLTLTNVNFIFELNSNYSDTNSVEKFQMSKSCVTEEGCVCDACLDSNVILLMLVRHLLDIPLVNTYSLLLSPGFADVRNGDADASSINHNFKQLVLAWEGGPYILPPLVTELASM